MMTVKKGKKVGERVSWKARALKAEAEVRRLAQSEHAVQAELSLTKAMQESERKTIEELAKEKTQLVREKEDLALQNDALRRDIKRWVETGKKLEEMHYERRNQLRNLESVAGVLVSAFLDKRSIPDALEEFYFLLRLLDHNTEDKQLREVVERAFQDGAGVTFRLIREKKSRVGTPGDKDDYGALSREEIEKIANDLFARDFR